MGLSSCIPFILSRLKGTVIFRIWWQCLFMLIHTGVILYIHNYVDGMKMNFPFSLVRILAGPTGLLLVFRTNTAYDRYWEGRKIWGTMTYQIRSLTMSLCLGVEDNPKTEENRETAPSPDDLDKASVLNLIVAFAYATKDHLRGQYNYEESEVKELLQNIPRFNLTPPSNQQMDQQATTIELNNANLGGSHETVMSNKSTSILFLDSKVTENGSSGGGDGDKGGLSDEIRSRNKTDPMKAHDFVAPLNMPLEIIYRIFSYMQVLKFERRADAITMKCLQASILSLMDCFTHLERILKTPIPLAYSIHLRFTVWLFLLALPYQFVGVLNWWTIPTVLISSVTLLGILAIEERLNQFFVTGGEIENPFGYDENDLPLDDFCSVIRKEIQIMVRRSQPPQPPPQPHQSPTKLPPVKLFKAKMPKF